MDALVATDVFLFECFRLDQRGGGLFRRDETGLFVPLPIGSRALEVLGVPIERAGELVTRDELMDAVWPGTVVESSNLPVQIAGLRRVLDYGRADSSCIQTIPGRGYRFVSLVTRAETATAASISGLGNEAGGPIAADEEPELPSALCPIDGLSPAPKPEAPPRRRRAVIASITAGAVCLAFIVVAAMNLRSLSPWEGRSAPRLSIIVLPFANFGNDPDQQYLADALTEDLAVDMSRIAHMFVISRNTAFTYKDKPVNARQIGREMGVRYVLEGSVQRSADRVRVATQLIDAENAAHLWAERFDQDMGDLFALQNEATRRLAAALSAELIAAEAARPTDNPDALDYILRGRAASRKGPTPDNYARSINLFEHALVLDPRSVEAQSLLGGALMNRATDGMAEAGAADMARAAGLADQALAASPSNPLAHTIKGNVLRWRGRCAEAIPEYEMAIVSDPNAVAAKAALGLCKLLTGSIEATIPLEEDAIRLRPRDGRLDVWYDWIGRVHLLQSRTDEAIIWLEKARGANPVQPFHRAYLAAAYALNGEYRRAAAELGQARRLVRDDRYSSISHLRASGFGSGYWGVSKIRDLFEQTYFAGLRKAGMPEE